MKLLLINRNNPLPKDYKPILGEVGGGYELERNAALAMKAMLCAAADDSVNLRIFSAYRSFTYQKGLFDECTDKYMLRGMSLSEAQRLAAVYVAPPGHSEHPAGLAADISSMDWQGEISRQFDNTLQFRWLEKNACKYGYILRYPKGKEAVTGLSYQPWHFRYVGRKHACFINKMGITLEEYMHKHRAYGL